jgi:hypothetical protein
VSGLYGEVWGQAGSTGASGSPSAAAPLYRVSFERRGAVSGISATPAIKLPWQCTSDGTIYISFVSTVPVNSGLPPPPGMPPLLLTAVSRAGHGQVFRLDQVPGLYISSEEDHYASDTEVIFLVRASRENKPEKRDYSVGTYRGEYTGNTAEQHLYVLVFSLEGEYRRVFELEDSFLIRRIGVFPSGTFLAFGFDAKDHSPKLAMLKEDGTLLKSLEIPKGDAPETLGTTKGRGFIVAPSELVPEGRAILVVQNKTTFPLLEVSEGGSIRAIPPKLPNGEQIEVVIPADRNLYVIAGPENATGRSAGVIYEVSPEDGALLRRFELSDAQRDLNMLACVHDGKFLGLDYGEGTVVPLIGTAEPVGTTASQQTSQQKR